MSLIVELDSAKITGDGEKVTVEYPGDETIVMSNATARAIAGLILRAADARSKSCLLFPIEPAKHEDFIIVAVSSNTGGFGHNGVVIASEDLSRVFEVQKNITSPPDTSVVEGNTVQVLTKEGVPVSSSVFSFECPPTRLPSPPPEAAEKIKEMVHDYNIGRIDKMVENYDQEYGTE